MSDGSLEGSNGNLRRVNNHELYPEASSLYEGVLSENSDVMRVRRAPPSATVDGMLYFNSRVSCFICENPVLSRAAAYRRGRRTHSIMSDHVTCGILGTVVGY